MGQIEDIRVNGQPSTASLLPTVAGIKPIIIWDFVATAASIGQVSFSIRIGTDPDNWGNDLFVGSEIEETHNSTSGWHECSILLKRGTTYYGQIRSKDENGIDSDWAKFQFATNNLPFVTNCEIVPINPTTADDLRLTYDYYDIDNHEESGTKVRWFRNNILVSDYDDLLVLPADATQPGDSWTAKIAPCDGLEYGSPVETFAVTIESNTSSIDEVLILPENPNVDDILRVHYSISEDEYAPVGAVLVEWYVNDQFVDRSNSETIRLDTNPGDSVYAVLKVVSGENVLVEGRSESVVVNDAKWHITNLRVCGLKRTDNLTDLAPILEWEAYKSTAARNDHPTYLQVLVTKTPSIDGPIYDSGVIEYVSSSYSIPSNILKRGHRYYVHVAASDSNYFSASEYLTQEIRMAGTSWSENVSNGKGWTIEFKAGINVSSSSDDPTLGLYIHDGTRFCSIRFGLRSITFLSETSLVYTYLDNEPSLRLIDSGGGKTFRIVGKGDNVRIFMNNQLVIDAVGLLTNPSGAKFVEYGDVDGKTTSEGVFKFFRYSTNGAYGLDPSLEDQDVFYFSTVGQISGGSIDFVFDDLIAWTPDSVEESTKLIKFSENKDPERYATVNMNRSPITSIFIDSNRNKYIGTGSGVVAIHGEKHDPDYAFITGKAITSTDFDRITNIQNELLSSVETNLRNGWNSINTTYRVLEEYNPTAPPILYYSQRTSGHAWYDNVDNEKGWQVSFSFDLDKLEADNFYTDANMIKSGFGVYVNDGTYQEIIYFYEDRIRLYYANVYVPIVTTVSRDYVITGKASNLKVYQKLSQSSTSAYELIIDGSGMFTAPASRTNNTTKPRIAIDGNGSVHAVWMDSTNRSRIVYSKYDGQWSDTEVISDSSIFSASNPAIDVDSLGRVWVAFEDTSFGGTEISVSVRDAAGWNPKTRLTIASGNKENPDIKVDSQGDVHVVWDDDRDGSKKIYAAKWDNSKKAWKSSAQHGKDEIVMQYKPNDPNQTGKVMEFRKPKMAFLNPYMWLVCEAVDSEDGTSMIYSAQYAVNGKSWLGSGSTVFDSVTGEYAGLSSGKLISPTDSEHCFNPDIATSPQRSLVLISWENHDEPISQIWGSCMSKDGYEITSPQKITFESLPCRNPTVTFLKDNALVVFEKDASIFSLAFRTSSYTFDVTPVEVNIESGVSASNPSTPNYIPGDSTVVLYDFSNVRDETIESKEFPDARMIGSAWVECQSSNSPSTLSDSRINNLDIKEFAFGDFSEDASMIANWKDIRMYFGYDARPHNLLLYGQSTIASWPDNRVNDLFIDAYGNIIAATFAGLVYYNVYTAQLTQVGGDVLNGKVVTSVKWGGNGIWYVGTTNQVVYSRDAGRTWSVLSGISGLVNRISIGKSGEAIVSMNGKIHIAHPDRDLITITLDHNIKSCEVDEANILWACSDDGVIRIENYSQFIVFDRNSGMRSSHANDVTIVNKHLRYFATSTGIERMNGMKFTNFNTRTHGLTSDNVLTVQWDSSTKSLWASTLTTLHEIVFRDPVYDIVETEVVHYNSNLLGLTSDYDRDTYYVLDYLGIENLTTDSASVYLNKNKVSFGFHIDETGRSIQFDTQLLDRDQVEVEISDRFTEYHDFNQSNVAIEVLGKKRTTIKKISRSGHGDQVLLLASGDQPSVILDAGTSQFPFATIVIDRVPPWGCLKQIDTLSRTMLRFGISASDDLSGVESYMLSNYENFTSDGTTPMEWQPIRNIVDHDIGGGINNVFDSLVFDSEVKIGASSYKVGNGAVLTSRSSSNKSYLYAATSAPIVIFRYDPSMDKWSALSIVDEADHMTSQSRVAHDFVTIGNVTYLMTGKAGGSGEIYASIDGSVFNRIGSVTGEHARGAVLGPDGTVYFGSSDGKIYGHGKLDGRITTFGQAFSNIGNSVHSIGCYGQNLYVGTGNYGRLYSVKVDTGDSLIVLDVADNAISSLLIKDAESSNSEANIYVAGSDYTTIYRSSMDDLTFVNSYSSYGNHISRIKQINAQTTDPSTTSNAATIAIAVIGKAVFKHSNPAWEFIYQHPDIIRDVHEFTSNDVPGIWVISDKRVTKWTAVLKEKKVYLRLRDKAGNISVGPNPIDSESTSLCSEYDENCCYVYSIRIDDLKNFVNEGRIVNVDEYGHVEYSYDSQAQTSIFSADRVDEEVGMYTSEVFNGSNDLVSWKSVSWQSVEPNGTEVKIQIRSGITDDACRRGEWSDYLVKSTSGNVSIEHITDQYLQFRATLISRVRDLSPSLTSVTLRNLTSQASHFFTTNFVLPSRPVKGLLTTNTVIPVSSDIVFGINTKNSVDFGDYQIIEPNRIFTTTQAQFGQNLRIGAKLLSPGLPQVSVSNNHGDPYDESSFVCKIDFEYSNLDSAPIAYHFRASFYNDPYRTQLGYRFFSGNDQTGWYFDGNPDSIFPATGLTFTPGQKRSVYFEPLSSIETNQKWYVTVEAWNGSEYEIVTQNQSFVCSSCNISQEEGLTAEYYRTGLPTLSEIPNFKSYTSDFVLIEPNVDFAANSGDWISQAPSADLSGWDNNFAIRFKGKILIPETGSYTFYLESSAGSILYVDGLETINNDGIHGPQEVSGNLDLGAGFHSIEIHYFKLTGTSKLKLSWMVPGGEKAVIGSEYLFHDVANEYCDDSGSPLINSIAVQFQLENGETVKLNL